MFFPAGPQSSASCRGDLPFHGHQNCQHKRTRWLQGRKDRALLALKRRKLQEGQAERLDGWLLNVQGMVGAAAAGVLRIRFFPGRPARLRGRRLSLQSLVGAFYCLSELLRRCCGAAAAPALAAAAMAAAAAAAAAPAVACELLVPAVAGATCSVSCLFDPSAAAAEPPPRTTSSLSACDALDLMSPGLLSLPRACAAAQHRDHQEPAAAVCGAQGRQQGDEGHAAGGCIRCVRAQLYSSTYMSRLW